MRDRYGEDALAHRFRAFDTICSATQDRQDAVRAMLDAGGLDLMIVIGGYNSSNTQALAAHVRAARPDIPHRWPRLHRGRRDQASSAQRRCGAADAALAAGSAR